MRYDLQEYDFTDIWNEVLDDLASYDGLYEWATTYPDGPDWDRVANSVTWKGALFTQWVEWVCGDRVAVEDVTDHLSLYVNNVLEPATLMIYQADNYEHIKSRDEAETVFDLINVWKTEGVI